MFDGILGYIFGGLVIGLLARMVKPGADAMGWIMTILLGILGAFVAEFDSRTRGFLGGSAGTHRRVGSPAVGPSARS